MPFHRPAMKFALECAFLVVPPAIAIVHKNNPTAYILGQVHEFFKRCMHAASEKLTIVEDGVKVKKAVEVQQ